MTKKHYIKLAEFVKSGRANSTDKVAFDTLAKNLADMCKQDNTAFKRDLFLRECGVES